jgi:hypothetical protein
MKSITIAGLVIALICSGLSYQSGFAKSSSNESKLGEKTYLASCECCHLMGKNVLKPGKDIVVSSKLASLNEFKQFLSEKHGLMPAFPKIVEDANVAKALYDYTKTLKNQAWTYEPEGIEKNPQDDEPSPPAKGPKKQGAGATR